jgi:HSP20 family protein
MIPSTWLRPVAFHNELDRFLHDFWSQSSPRGFAHTAGHAPALNVYETDSGFEIELEVPGLALEDLEVQVEGREIAVRGERKFTLPENGAWQRRERAHGSFERKLRLPVDIDAAQLEAHLDQGLLRLICPKAQSAVPRKISVQTKTAPSTEA